MGYMRIIISAIFVGWLSVDIGCSAASTNASLVSPVSKTDISAAISKWQQNHDWQSLKVIEAAIRTAREKGDKEFLRAQARVWTKELTIYRGYEHYDEAMLLTLIGPLAVPEILPLLEDPKPASNAIGILGAIGGPEALRIFSSWLAAPDAQKRFRAIHGLRCMSGPESLDLLVRILETDTNKYNRAEAGRAVAGRRPRGERLDTRTLDVLIRHLDDWAGVPGGPYKVHPLDGLEGKRFGWDHKAWQNWWQEEGKQQCSADEAKRQKETNIQPVRQPPAGGDGKPAPQL